MIILVPIKAALLKATGMRFLFMLFFISGTCHSLEAQDLEPHRWRDRVLLLITGDLKNPEYIRQTHALQERPAELEARKLMVCTVVENRYAKGLPAGSWRSGVQNRFAITDAKTGFRLVLIGLDGGVKLDTSSFVPLEPLWALIDGMPMRRAELENKGNP